MPVLEYRPLYAYAERYATLPVVPLRVTAFVRSPLAHYDPVNLDNLLARLVVEEATGGSLLPESPIPYALPVPLQALWHSADGLPLWAATPFVPADAAIEDTVYWHKRGQPGTFSRGRLQFRNGRWMERRVPMPLVRCRVWTAEAVGHPDEIARLLQRVAFIGKKRSMGLGEVERWLIEPLPQFSLLRGDRLARSLPAAALALCNGLVPEGQPAPVGWTPPQWMPRLFRPGWWPGTPVHLPHNGDAIDWYAAVDGL